MSSRNALECECGSPNAHRLVALVGHYCTIKTLKTNIRVYTEPKGRSVVAARWFKRSDMRPLFIIDDDNDVCGSQAKTLSREWMTNGFYLFSWFVYREKICTRKQWGWVGGFDEVLVFWRNHYRVAWRVEVLLWVIVFLVFPLELNNKSFTKNQVWNISPV